MKTTVVNLHGEPFDVYIGRPSIWGNPYSLRKNATEEERAECIEKFKKHFLNNPELMKRAREELKGMVLGCYCKPLACHGDVIADYVNGEDK